MAVLLAVSGSFLLGILSMDLAFDVQALQNSADQELVVASIAGYYGRILGDDNPVANLVIAVMLTAILGAVYQVLRPQGSRWFPVVALVLGGGAIALTATQVVPAATEIVNGTEPVPVLFEQARHVATVHLGCFTAFLGYVVIELWLARASAKAST